MPTSYPHGPWIAGVVFPLPAPVVSKSNHRHRRSSTDWRRFKAFEDTVHYAARAALPTTWPPLAAELPLARRPVVAIAIVASTKVDASNLSKSIADALEGVCFANDASARAVVSIALRPVSGAVNADPVVGVAAFDADVAPGALAAGVNELLLATVAAYAAP